MSLVKHEENHAKSLVKMYRILLKKPECFEKGRNFNVVAVHTFIRGIENNMKSLQQGNLKKNKVIYIARDIEQAFIESKIHEILKTDDVEYQTLAQDIVTQTRDHSEAINKKIKTIVNIRRLKIAIFLFDKK